MYRQWTSKNIAVVVLYVIVIGVAGPRALSGAPLPIFIVVGSVIGLGIEVARWVRREDGNAPGADAAED